MAVESHRADMWGTDAVLRNRARSELIVPVDELLLGVRPAIERLIHDLYRFVDNVQGEMVAG